MTRFLNGNSEDDVRRQTESAARCADARPEAPERAAGILNELRAVSYPTASVFLTAWNPSEFGIMDARTWRALRALTGMATFDRVAAHCSGVRSFGSIRACSGAGAPESQARHPD